MLLEINDIDISYGDKLTVQDFSLKLGEGKICSLVGESGSGKTTVIRAVLGLLPGAGKVTKGDILFEGNSLLQYSPAQWRELRGTDISMIFSKAEAWDVGVKMLERMHLPNGDNVMRSYPFQLSGGMRQRVGIAMAMTFQPKLLLADEPTSALDVTTQAQIVRQMMELRDEYGTSIIIVTHNLGVAAYMSDYLVVMKMGQIEDEGTREHILYETENEYTQKLLAAVPSVGGERYV